MAAMATYAVESDSYAGFGSTGKYFLYFGLAAGAVGLTGWAAMHSLLPGLRSADAGSQLFLVAIAWIGGGLSLLLMVALLGSLMLSSKSRGTVAVDDVGVLRRIGKRSRMLRWEEIEGFVATPISGGVTVIPRSGRGIIEIPRFLDDYRGCLAELKAHGVQSLPTSRLKPKRGWRQALRNFAVVYMFLLAYDARSSHAIRLACFFIWIGFFVWSLIDEELNGRAWFRWFSGVVFLVMVTWAIHHMVHTW
jgi:hypothetical protein